jgi:hypothetical protein
LLNPADTTLDRGSNRWSKPMADDSTDEKLSEDMIDAPLADSFLP